MQITLTNLKEASLELQLETRNWRNSSNVSKYFQLNYISIDDHKQWLSNLHKVNFTTIAFLIECNGKHVGLTYFHSIDRIAKNTDWGIYIHDIAMRGIGIGRCVLKECINYAKTTMGMKQMNLEVKKDNFSAIRLYESFGFVFTKNKDQEFMQFSKSFESKLIV